MRADVTDDLDALGDRWAALWRADPAATPFQAPACLLAWARVYAPGRSLAATVFDGGALAALAPLFHWRGVLMLAGTGALDYGDGVFAERNAGPVCLAAIAAAADALGLDRIELRQLRPASPLAHAPGPPGWRETRGPDVPCPVARLTGADGLAGLKGKVRAGLRQTCAKAARAGRLEFFALANSQAGLAILLKLHARRWARSGLQGALSDPLLARFLALALPALAAEGLARLRLLTIDARPAAALLALERPGASHFYMQGVEPDFAALAPGVVLLAQAFAEAAAAGHAEAHFLRGAEPYKARWGATGGETLRRDFARD